MAADGQRIGNDARSEPREAVLYRTRLVDMRGLERAATLVDLSQHGFMARSDAVHAEGDRVVISLPRLGRIGAEVRWSLAGRIGCRLDRAIDVADYHALLHILPRG